MRSSGSPRAGARVGAQLAAEVEAVAVGQHQVEHERVEVLGREALASGAERAGGGDVEAGIAQVVAHHGRQAGVVVDQQQS